MRLARLFLLAAWVSAGCGSDELELPRPPDADRTRELLAIYEEPTGSIDPGAIQALAEQVTAQLSEQDLQAWSEYMASSLAGLRERLDDSSMPTDPDTREDDDRARLRAVVTLTRICGDRTAPPDAQANGTFSVTATIEEGALSRQVWGTAHACRIQLDRAEILRSAATPGADAEPLELQLDAVVLAYLYGALPTSLADARFLLRFGAALQAGGERATTEFDLRVINGRLEFRHAVADGDIVAGIDADGLELRGRNASFTCQLDTLECHRAPESSPRTDPPVVGG